MIKKALLIIVLTLSAFLLIGCSGDEIIGTGVQGLKLPSSINIATPKTEKPIRSNAQLTALHPAAFNDPGTDYNKDKTSIYIEGVIVATNTGDTVLTAVDQDNDANTPELPVAATLTFTDGQTRKFKDINYANSLITYRYQHNASV